MTAYHDGWVVGVNDGPLSDNPFDIGSPEHHQWTHGHIDGRSIALRASGEYGASAEDKRRAAAIMGPEHRPQLDIVREVEEATGNRTLSRIEQVAREVADAAPDAWITSGGRTYAALLKTFTRTIPGFTYQLPGFTLPVFPLPPDVVDRLQRDLSQAFHGTIYLPSWDIKTLRDMKGRAPITFEPASRKPESWAQLDGVQALLSPSQRLDVVRAEPPEPQWRIKPTGPDVTLESPQQTPTRADDRRRDHGRDHP